MIVIVTMAGPARMALPVFSGHQFDPLSATAFLQDFENYCRLYAIDDDDKPNTIASSLKDDARAWLLQLKNITSSADFLWDHIKRQFLAYWTAPVPRANRFQLAADCKQKPGEAVRTFLSRCCNVAFETLTPMSGDVLGDMAREVTAPAVAADGNDPAQIERDFTASFILDPDDLREVNMYYAKEFAMNLFVAGCHPQVRHHLSLDKSWDSWEELMSLAISIEATVAPGTLSRALKQFDPALSKSNVNAVSDVADAPSTPDLGSASARPGPAQVAPVGQTRSPRSAKPKGRPPPRGPPRPKAPQPQAAPDPQQRRTHTNPVTCYFCGGQFHTERHCLAKQKRLALAPHNAVSFAAFPPLAQPAPGYGLPEYPAPPVQPDPTQLATVAAPYVWPHPQPLPPPLPQPTPAPSAPPPVYPQPHFFGGE